MTTENWQWVKQTMFTENGPQRRHARRTPVVSSVVTCIVTQPFYSTGPKPTANSHKHLKIFV